MDTSNVVARAMNGDNDRMIVDDRSLLVFDVVSN